MLRIDWEFIESLEGNTLRAVVPNPLKSNSGVTVASGVDLGQYTLAELHTWELPFQLLERLKPYIGLRKQAAVTALKQMPLVITRPDAELLNRKARAVCLHRLLTRYNHVTVPTGRPGFEGLATGPQTVMASVSFQYGSLPERTPRFWQGCVEQDWEAVAGELDHFGDDYPTRRRKEAGFLRTHLDDAEVRPLPETSTEV